MEDVNQDLVVELHGATVDKGSLNSQSHFIPNLCTEISPRTTQNLLSDEDPLKITSLSLKNDFLYHNGHWEPTRIPKLLRSASSSRAQKGCTSAKQQACSGKGVRTETVHRRIPGTLQEESIQGTFIPVAGSEEKQVANWLNKITCALEPFIPPIPATSDRVLTCSATAIPLRSWTSETSRKPVKDALMSWKPDIILQENLAQVVYGPQPEFLWKSIISFIELTSSLYSSSDSSGAIRSAIICKAYAIFASQPNRRFVFGLSIASQKFHAHMFNRSGVVHSCGYDIH